MKKNIKICALTTVSQTMDAFMVDFMRKLAENGYDITLVCNMTEEFIKKNSDFATCVHLPMKRGVSLPDVFRNIKALKKLFKKERFDVLYYASPNAALYASLAGKQTKIKTRIYSQCGIRYVALTGWKRAVFKCIEKWTCKNSTHVRSQSPLNMQFVIDESVCKKEKISVVGIGGTIGVDIDACDSFDHTQTKRQIRSRLGIPQDAFVYGYVGRLNKDKGVNELVNAFSIIEKTNDKAYLMLVGGNDQSNPILPQTKKLVEENDRIVATGNVAKDEVYPYMAAFDVLVHPTYREGFGKVLQEAMGMRLPIITTDVRGPKEVVEFGEYGVLVPAQNVESLAKAMEDIATDEELREQLSKKGRERAEKYFDRPIMINNVLQDINAIVKGE